MKKSLPLLFLFFSSAAWGAPPVEGASKSAKLHFLQAMLLERRGADAEALAEYEKAFSFDPHSAYLCAEAAALALDAGNSKAALSWVSRLERLEPKSTRTLILRGRAQWALGLLPQAQEAFEAAILLDPKSAESIFSLGSLLSARFPDKARELFERFLKQNPEDAAEAHYQIALLDQKAGKTSNAVKRLKQSIALDSGAVTARYSLAQIYEVRRDTDAALGEYLEILRLEPQNVALLNHIGEIYYLKGLMDEAQAKFLSAQAIYPSDPVSSQWLAAIFEASGDFARAADYLKGSSAINDDAALNLRLSYYLTQAGALKEAVAVLEKAHAKWPANEELSYFLALGYDDLKLADKAVALLRQIVRANSGYRDARYQLAVLLEKSGKMEEAETEFRALLAVRPDDAGVLNYLGYSLADRGLKLDAARELVERAVRLDPQNGAYQDSLGWVYFKMGRSTQAVAELLGALEKIPEDPTVWGHLGDAYAASGRQDKAWRAWKKAYSLDAADAASASKASKLESRFSPEDMGGLYLEYLSQAQGGLRKFSGLCEIKGTILGRSFTYDGVLTFRGPGRLDVDLLGPLFTPLLRIRMTPEGFSMDPVHIEGISTEALTQAAVNAFSALRDYFEGKFFGEGPVKHKAGWRARSLSIPGWQLGLSADGLRVESLEAQEGAALRIELSRFKPQKGRQTPMTFTIAGRGYSFAIDMRDAGAEYK